MTELSLKVQALNLIRGHDKNYWCRKGSHWLLKDSALLKFGKPFCPYHRSQVSANTRVAAYKHEEKVTRY